jgi:hypothetical protein
MGKCFLFLLFSLFSFQAWSQLRLYNATAYMTDSTFVSPIQVLLANPGTDSATWIFIPISTLATSAAETNTLYEDIPLLPQGGGFDNVFINSPKVGLVIENRYNANKKIAVYTKVNDTNWQLVPITGGEGNGYLTLSSFSNYEFYFPLKNVCSVTGTNCNAPFTTLGASTTAGGSSFKTSQYIYVQSFDPQSTPGNVPFTLSADPSSSGTGLLFNLRLSANILTPSFQTSGIHRGDTSLALDYNGAATAGSFDSTEGLWRAIIINAPGIYSSETDLKAVLPTPTLCDLKEVRPTPSCYIVGPNVVLLAGTISAYNLVNGNSYNLAVVLANKYKFTTKVGNTQPGTPQEIEVFLREQQCYFLSAGFQDHHFVLNYFRHFRDEVLNSTRLGRVLVNFYYETAPQYTHHIFNNPQIALFFRGLGHSLYWVFNSILCLMSLLSAFVAKRYLKRFFK